MAKGEQKPGETVQIVILTLLMTTGFFALFTVVFLFLIPGKESEVSSQVNDLKALREVLKQNGELWDLRAQVDRLGAQAEGDGDQDTTLRGIADSELKSLQIDSQNLPRTIEKKASQNVKTVEYSQTVNYTKVDTQSLLQLIARIKARRQGIRLASVQMTRDRTAPAEDPTWNGRLVFKYYENPEIQAEFERRRTRAAATAARQAKSAEKTAETAKAD